MAVTLSIADLSAALRLGDSAEELKEVTRLHAYASEAVNQYAPDAPENTANEAAVRLAAQLFDQPTSSRGAYANALRVSGAARILMPYRVHRAGSTADAVAIAQGAVGTTGNPVIDVAVSGAEIVVTFADGSTESHDLPAVSGVGTDQDARDAAAAATESAGVGRLAAAAAQVTADAARPTLTTTKPTTQAAAEAVQIKRPEIQRQLHRLKLTLTNCQRTTPTLPPGTRRQPRKPN